MKIKRPTHIFLKRKDTEYQLNGSYIAYWTPSIKQTNIRLQVIQRLFRSYRMCTGYMRILPILHKGLKFLWTEYLQGFLHIPKANYTGKVFRQARGWKSCCEEQWPELPLWTRLVQNRVLVLGMFPGSAGRSHSSENRSKSVSHKALVWGIELFFLFY